MQGGGTNGSWEAGVLWGFLHYGDPKDFEYDVISGVSVGAFSTYVGTHYEKGEELAFSEKLSDFWSSLDTYTLYEQENLLQVFKHQLLNERNSLYDNSKAWDYVRGLEFPHNDIMRRFSITALDLNSGHRQFFNQDNID